MQPAVNGGNNYPGSVAHQQNLSKSGHYSQTTKAPLTGVYSGHEM